jgi:hypothetical protein
MAILRDPDGEERPFEEDQADPRRPHGLPQAPARPLPATPAACEVEEAELRAAIGEAEARTRRMRPVEAEFLRSEPNPALTEEFRREVERADPSTASRPSPSIGTG